MSEKMVEVEIDFEQDDLFWLAMKAHEEDITLNQLINKMLMEYIQEQDDGKSND